MEVARRSSFQLAGWPGATVVALVSVALLLMPAVVEAALEDYPYIGCYNDMPERVMKRQMQPDQPLTLAGCATACLKDQSEGKEWKFAGLQYGQEW